MKCSMHMKYNDADINDYLDSICDELHPFERAFDIALKVMEDTQYTVNCLLLDITYYGREWLRPNYQKADSIHTQAKKEFFKAKDALREAYGRYGLMNGDMPARMYWHKSDDNLPLTSSIDLLELRRF